MPAFVSIKSSAHNIVMNNLYTSYFSNLYTCVNMFWITGCCMRIIRITKNSKIIKISHGEYIFFPHNSV